MKKINPISSFLGDENVKILRQVLILIVSIALATAVFAVFAIHFGKKLDALWGTAPIMLIVFSIIGLALSATFVVFVSLKVTKNVKESVGRQSRDVKNNPVGNSNKNVPSSPAARNS